MERGQPPRRSRVDTDVALALPRLGPLRAATASVALVAVYVGAAWLGTELGRIGSLTVWYPPAGVAVAACLVAGWRAVPVLAVAEVIAGVAVFDADETFSAAQLVVNAAGYAAVWAVAAGIIRRGVADPELRRLVSQVALALGVAVLAAPLVAATWGITMQRWAGLDERPFTEAVGVWWTGDAVGVASITPTLLVIGFALRQRSFGDYRVFGGRQPVVVLAQLASPMAVAVLVFALRGDGVRFPYLVIVPVVLVALRFGIEGAAVSTLGLAPVMTNLVSNIDGTDAIDRTELQVLLLVGITTSLVVGTVVTERERFGRLHRELSAVIETTPDLVSIVDDKGNLRYLNPAARAVAGLDPDDDVADLRDVDLDDDPVVVSEVEQARFEAQRDGSWAGDVVFHDDEGRPLTGSKVVIVHRGRDGTPERTTSIIRDTTEQRRLEQQLTHHALYDDLTGLPNRVLLVERLHHAQKRHRSTVLLLATIDRYGVITEGVGHRGADTVVREVGLRIAGRLGPADTVARVDHDAFAVLVDHDLDEFGACAIGDRLAAEVGGQIDTGERPVAVTISVGAATSSPTLYGDELVRAAEVAARRAAELGGHRTVVYRDRMSASAQQRLDAELELRDSIDHERWWLAYQPIIDLRSGSTVSCEALLRWPEAEGAPSSTYELVMLAEETGLIVPLGRSVLARACLDSVGWASGGHRVSVAVNVSARQLVEPGFTDSFADVLRHTGTDPRVVTLELTETSFAGDPRTVRPLLDELTSLGVELAMDDFGTGYSSLAQLGDLPLDRVKLDKTFIDDLETSQRRRDVVAAVITLAHALGLSVVAEGVEHAAQLEILRDLGCDRAQGFLFSTPVPPEELGARLAVARRRPPGASREDIAAQAIIDRFG